MSLSAIMILSPARRPTFSLGPPFMTLTTVAVSCFIRKVTPIPTKSPRICSATSVMSLFGIYTECGSNSDSIELTVLSTISSVFTVSTYSLSIKSISLFNFSLLGFEEYKTSLELAKNHPAPKNKAAKKEKTINRSINFSINSN